jgi:hypothetical protein
MYTLFEGVPLKADNLMIQASNGFHEIAMTKKSMEKRP